MAKFILLEDLDRASEDPNIKTKRLIAEAVDLNSKSFIGDFTNQDRQTISGILSSFFFAAYGNFISSKTAGAMRDAFDENPNSFTIKKKTYDDFVKELDDLHTKVAIPANHEWGLRFYFGNISDTQYSIVIVPAHGLAPFGDDHSEDVEKGLWSSYGFFGLVPSLDSILHKLSDCGNLIPNTDKSTIRLAGFPWISFKAFTDSLEKAKYEEMQFTFGRWLGGKDELTVIITAFDSVGNNVIIQTGRPIVGMCYDQGDLIPPPPTPVPDTSF